MKKSTEADLGVLPPGVPLISTCSPTYLMLFGRYFWVWKIFGFPVCSAVTLKSDENVPNFKGF